MNALGGLEILARNGIDRADASWLTGGVRSG